MPQGSSSSKALRAVKKSAGKLKKVSKKAGQVSVGSKDRKVFKPTGKRASEHHSRQDSSLSKAINANAQAVAAARLSTAGDKLRIRSLQEEGQREASRKERERSDKEVRRREASDYRTRMLNASISKAQCAE